MYDCVTTSISKLRWILPDVFIWGGNKSCASTAILYVAFVFKSIFEVLEVVGAIWWSKREHKNAQKLGTSKDTEEQSFSFSRLTFAFLQGFGVETLMAYLLYREAIVGFLAGLFVIFLYTPRPVPFTAGLTGVFLGKAWGVQMLVVDGLIAMVAASTVSPIPLGDDGYFSLAPPPPSGPDVPMQFPALYYGLFIANYPVYLLFAAYLILGIILPFMALVYLCIPKKRYKAKACLKIFLLMLLLLAYPFVVPILGFAEVIFKLVHWKDKKRKFGPVRWADDLLQGVSPRKMAVLSVLYWVWCVLHFVIFVGRWMVVVNMLAIAGEVFCPSSLGEVVGGGLGATIGLVLANLGLQVSGLSY